MKKYQQLSLIFLGVITVAAGGMGFYRSLQEKNNRMAGDKLFSVKETIQKELETYLKATYPKEDGEKLFAKLEGTKFDVEAVLKESIVGLKDVMREAPHTRAAFEAAMVLGGLYFDYSSSPTALVQAHEMYQKAFSLSGNAPYGVRALYGAGVALEQAQQYEQALKVYDKAAGYSALGYHAEILSAKARTEESLNKISASLETYRKLEKESPQQQWKLEIERLQRKLNNQKSS